MKKIIAPDITNENLRYWETVLEGEGLGIRQLGLHEDLDDNETSLQLDDNETSLQAVSETVARKKSNNNKDFEQLRMKMDKGDSFLAGGHQIKKIRVHGRKTPDWALRNTGVRAVIETAFPKWRVNVTQRQRAARWAQVIYLFYRVGMSRPQTAREMKVKSEMVKNILNRMRRVARGIQASNAGKRAS